MIKFRFITDPGFSSWLIRWWSDSEYSHVDLALPDGTFLGARLDGGVQIRPNDYILPTKELWLGLELGTDLESKIYDYAKSKIGTPYDWRNILSFGFDQDYHSGEHGYICSVFAYDILKAFNVQPIRLAYSSQCTPGDLTLSLNFVETTAWPVAQNA